MSIEVPFYKPNLPDWAVVEDDIKNMYNDGYLAPGKYTDRFEELVKSVFGVKHAVAFSNCSDAMMCVVSWVKRITGKTTVAVPSFTFASTWQAVDWNNMTTAVVDCDEEGLIDIQCLEKLLKETSGSLACIMATHISGNPSHICELKELSEKYGIPVVFDSAHGIGTTIDGKYLGNNGLAEIFSIGTTKPVATGEGGLITTNNDDLANAMRMAAMHGHKFGELDVELKSLNGRIQEFNSILGYYGLLGINESMKERSVLAGFYNSKFPFCVESDRFEVVVRPQVKVRESICPSYKDYTLFIRVLDKNSGEFVDPFFVREALVCRLENLGVYTKRYYYPDIANLTDVKKDTYKNIVMAPFYNGHSEYLSRGCVSIPFYNGLSKESQEYVVSSVISIVNLIVMELSISPVC